MATKNRFLTLLLLIIPIVFLWFGFQFDRTKYGTDPESAYLMNGLNIATLHSVGHYDNPGTTVQAYSAAVLRIAHTIRHTGTDIETDVLQNSEFYIELLRHSIIILNALMLLVAGITAFYLLGNIWPAMLLQVSPFMSTTLIEELYTKVAPEPFLFFTTMLFIISMLAMFKQQQGKAIRYSVIFGILTGFGIATKLTFLPLALIPLLILKPWKSRWIFAGVTVLSFIFFTLPAIKGYGHMAAWFFNLGTHSGTYGQGNQGIIDPQVYVAALKDILINNAALSITIILLGIFSILFWHFKKASRGSESSQGWIFLFAILLAQTLSILMVAKHYHSNHYLFPALTLTGAAWIFAIMLTQNAVSEHVKKYTKWLMPVIFVVFTTIAFGNIPYLAESYKGYRMSNSSTDSTMNLLQTEYKDFTKVYYYPTSFNLYSSLRWGNVYSRQMHTAALTKLYPEGLFFDARTGHFQCWETDYDISSFVSRFGSKLLLVGGPLNEAGLQELNAKGLSLKKLYESRLQVIYQIDTANSELFQREKTKMNPLWSLNCDFELLSADKQWILSSDKPFCKNESLQQGEARSGNHAIKLSGSDQFAMNYLLSNVQPGEQYEASVWRKASTEGSSLVVTANNTGLLYMASEKGINTDAHGWQKLVVDFKIPADFKEHDLKIYLWNHDNSSALFDDFNIIRYK